MISRLGRFKDKRNLNTEVLFSWSESVTLTWKVFYIENKKMNFELKNMKQKVPQRGPNADFPSNPNYIGSSNSNRGKIKLFLETIS